MSGPVRKKRKQGRNISVAELHVLATFNNTIISLTDTSGNLLSSSSSGSVGAKGSNKSSNYYASIAARKIIALAKSMGVKILNVILRGPGINGRDAIARALDADKGIAVSYLKDITPVPHNGCRPRKKRRV